LFPTNRTNGCTLTTLAKTDGTWLADTVWFK